MMALSRDVPCTLPMTRVMPPSSASRKCQGDALGYRSDFQKKKLRGWLSFPPGLSTRPVSAREPCSVIQRRRLLPVPAFETETWWECRKCKVQKVTKGHFRGLPTGPLLRFRGDTALPGGNHGNGLHIRLDGRGSIGDFRGLSKSNQCL
jgi:hypothetical protein